MQTNTIISFRQTLTLSLDRLANMISKFSVAMGSTNRKKYVNYEKKENFLTNQVKYEAIIYREST